MPILRLPVRIFTNPLVVPVVNVIFPEVAVAKAKVPDVTDREAEESPVALKEPEVATNDKAPVVIVKPFEAVRVEAKVPVDPETNASSVFKVSPAER